MNRDAPFDTWPYVALTIAAVGLLARYFTGVAKIDETRRQAAEAKAVFAGVAIGRVALVLLLSTHLVGLALPNGVLAWNAVPLRLYVLEGGTFLAGGLAIGACAEAMYRHLARPCRSMPCAVGDAVLLGLVFVAMTSGLLLQAIYRWGSSWGAATLTPYLASVARGRPSTELVDQMPFLVRIHLVSSFGIVAAFPFTRLASMLIVGCRGLVASIGTSFDRSLGATSAKIMLRVESLIWPEEDTEAVGASSDAWIPRRSGIVPARVSAIEAHHAEDAETLYETKSG